MNQPITASSIPHVKEMILPFLPGPPSPRPTASARDILERHLLTLHSGRRFKLLPSWQGVDTLSRTDQRSLHIHGFIGDLVAAHETNPNPALLHFAAVLVDDWNERFKYPRDKGVMAFHDETVARRLTYWLQLYLHLRINMLPELSDRLWGQIEATVAILSQEEFHAGLNNHGMFQDFALLYYSAFTADAQDIRRTCIQRLHAYFEWSICDDGVHKEHSPAYHFLIARNIYVHLRFLDRLDAGVADSLRSLLHKMGRYALNIVAPDGMYPPLGDTTACAVPSTYYKVFGLTGSIPEPSAFFHQGGYAVLRDDPEKGKEQTYAVLCASHHGAYHKHQDDLSVLLYSGGWIISESGPYGYDYGNLLSQHGYSSAAHSTLLVGGSNPRRSLSTEIGLVKVDKSIEEVEFCAASATNRRHADVVHERTLTLNRKKGLVYVIDVVNSSEARTLSLLWQLAPDLEAIAVGDEVHLKRGGIKVAKVCIKSDVPVSLTLIRGNQDTQTPGYVFPKMGECKETTVLRVETLALEDWLCRTTFVLPSRTSKGLRHKLVTCSGPWPIQFYFEPYVNSKILVVVFPAMADEHVYPIHYKKALQNASVNRLFLVDDFGPQGSYLIASKGSLGLADAVCSLIEEFRSRLGIEEDSVVFLGSSKGGASALYFAHRLGYGHVVAGAPQTRIGYFLHRQDLGNGPNLSSYMFPGGVAEERLNRLIYELPVGLRVSRHIHVGRGDHHYQNHVLPYVQHVAAQGGEVSLDVADYETHKEVGIHFPAFIEATLQALFGITLNQKEAAPAVSAALISVSEGRAIKVSCSGKQSGSMLAHYLYQNGDVVRKHSYIDESDRLIPIFGRGVFHVRVFIRTPDGKTAILNTNKVRA